MDYRLKSLYEQMLRGETVEQASGEQPKNLAAAYQVMLNERVAFYKLDVGDTNPPNDPSGRGAELVGVTTQPIRISTAINAISIEPEVENLSKLADENGTGWHTSPIQGINLHEISKMFLDCNVLSQAVGFISKYKDTFINCSMHFRPQGPGKFNVFNLRNETIVDLTKERDGNKIPAKQEDLIKLYNKLWPVTGKVGMASTGAGEMVTTMLTNAKKGKVGDLVFEEDQVEIKGIEGRLGKASFGYEGTAPALANFLEKNKTQRTAYSETYDIKLRLLKKLREIESSEKLKEIVSQDYINAIKKFIENVNDVSIVKQIAKQTQIGIGNIAATRLKYLKYNGVPLEKETKDQFDGIHKSIHKAIKTLIEFKPSDISGSLTPQYFRDKTYTVAVPRFFNSDLGLSYEQAAEAFLFTKSSSYNSNDEPQYRKAIYEFFKQHYDSMKHGSRKHLEAILFGYLLTIYKKAHEFKYFAMINDFTQEAISFNVGDSSTSIEELVTNLAKSYLENPNLSMEIKADNTHGACAVTFGQGRTKK